MNTENETATRYGREFSDRLRYLRNKKKISAREMSIALGQNVNYINLIENGKSPDTPAAVLSGGNAPLRQCIRGTLETLPTLAKDARAPAVILVGEVTDLGNEFAEYSLVFPGAL